MTRQSQNTWSSCAASVVRANEHMSRGRFISFEGIEGVGKSSNIDVLVSHVEKAGYEVLTTREPGGTPLAEDIRHLLMHRGDEAIPEIAELLMMFAARSLNVNNNILPALNAGKWVVCDRFTDSSRAYQSGGRGLPMETVNQLAEWVHGGLWPDLTILLDAPVEVGMARAGNRGKPDRIEREENAFFGRVRESYLQQALLEPDRFVVLDTTRDLAAVQADVIALVQPLLDDNRH
jgi:dTMP kinase